MIHLFGDRLRELRKNKNVSQEEIGDFFGVAKQTISNWENNITEPTMETIKKMAEYFKVTTDYLLGFNQEDKDKISKLETVLKEYGIDDLEKAMQILEILKENKNE